MSKNALDIAAGTEQRDRFSSFGILVTSKQQLPWASSLNITQLEHIKSPSQRTVLPI